MSDSKQRTLLITGGAGFIGSNFIRLLLQIPELNLRIINVDALTYAGNLENLQGIDAHSCYSFVHADIQNTDLMRTLCSENAVEGIINFAAESHVDRSINNAQPFVNTNISGTLSLLTVAHELQLKFLQVSTDEVYGTLELDSKDRFTEESPISPNSPYAASKASADCFVRAFHHTHGLHAVITRCSNNYGPRQFPEKLIPLMILNALREKQLPVYGNGLNVRDWIHVDDHCRAVWLAYENGKSGQVYNIGSDNEKKNIDIVKLVLNLLKKSEDLIAYVQDRPGHDLRYAINAEKAHKELGWHPEISFEQGIQDTIDWYINNPAWCENILSGAYREYYAQQYTNK